MTEAEWWHMYALPWLYVDELDDADQKADPGLSLTFEWHPE